MIIITGFQRSGTTALGEILDSSSAFRYFGEVFHPLAYVGGEAAEALRLRPRASYFRWFENHRGETGVIPTPELMSSRWRDYAAFLSQLSGGAMPVIDIKYNSWHHFNSVWQSPDDEPNLVRILAHDSALTIVHLIRRDILDMCVSERVAAEGGTWHHTQDFKGPENPVNISPDALIYRLRQARIQRPLFQNWLKILNPITLIYEQSFDQSGRLKPKVISRLAARVALPIENVVGSVIRPKVRPVQRIQNREEVAAALKCSEFGHFASRIATIAA